MRWQEAAAAKLPLGTNPHDLYLPIVSSLFVYIFERVLESACRNCEAVQ